MDGRDTDEDLAEAQADTLAKIAAAWPGNTAPRLRVLPSRVTVSELDPDDAGQLGVPIGIAETDLGTARLNLNDGEPHLLVFGDVGSGKSTFLRTWLRGLSQRTSSEEARFVLVDYRRGLLGAVGDPHLGGYAGEGTTTAAYTQQLAEALASRLPPAGLDAAAIARRDWWHGPHIYLVVDDYDMVGNARPNPLAPLADFMPHARDIGFHVVLARRVAGLSRAGLADPLIGPLRELGSAGLLLSGDPKEGVLLGDHRAEPRPPGRGLLVTRSAPSRVVHVAMES
jgi:S-DNA-T family DNA segregation ATPase FtsK/SpoIIIE